MRLVKPDKKCISYQRRRRLRFFLAVVLIFFSACEFTFPSKDKSADSLLTGEITGTNAMPYGDENAYIHSGEYYDVQYRIEYPHIDMPEVDKYISAWADKLVRDCNLGEDFIGYSCVIDIGSAAEQISDNFYVFRQTGSISISSLTAAETPPHSDGGMREIIKLVFVDTESRQIFALQDMLLRLAVADGNAGLYTQMVDHQAVHNQISDDYTLISAYELTPESLTLDVIGETGGTFTLSYPQVIELLSKELDAESLAMLEDAIKSAAEAGGDPQPEAPKKKIALTFDDGPSPVTGKILDLLETYDIKATFFIIGQEAAYYKDMVRRIDALGMEIGNHTWNHYNLTKVKKYTIYDQLGSVQTLLEELTGKAPTLCRPPYGDFDYRVEAIAKEMGISLINWSIDPWDWEKRDAAAIYHDVMEHVHDGGIILLHDIYEETALAVSFLIPALLEQGYEFVTVSELFEEYGEELMPGGVYRFADKVN